MSISPRGDGIYGYDAPASVSVFGRLVAAMLGLVVAMMVATNLLVVMWGPPRGAEPLIPHTLSAFACAAAILTCAAWIVWKQPTRLGPWAAGLVAFLLALRPVYNPIHFWAAAAAAVAGELRGTQSVVVLGSALAAALAVGVLVVDTMRSVRLKARAVKGSTQWGKGEALKAARKGMILGTHAGKRLRYDGSGHLLTVAATRSGKGVSTIIPNLLTFPGSAVVTDPKGENFLVTARWRRKTLGHTVAALDPFGITRMHVRTDEEEAGIHSWNPLDVVDTKGEDYVESAMMLAEMIIPQDKQSRDPHWAIEGKAMLYAFILFAATQEDRTRRNLVEVRRMITAEAQEMVASLDLMQQSKIPQVQEGAARIMQKSERERSGVLSTVQSRTHFLSSPKIARVITSSSFEMEALVQDRLSLYIVLPMEHLTGFAPWLRLMVGSAYYAATHDVLLREPSRERILFMLDEFASLGYMENIKGAMSLGAGYGVSMWLILQDLAQLKREYREEWESFVANSDVLQAFAIQDTFSAERISKMLGQTTVWQRKTRRQSRREGGRLLKEYDEESRPLLRPEELRRLHPNKQVLLVRPYQPLAASKVRYYSNPDFRGKFDSNPYVR